MALHPVIQNAQWLTCLLLAAATLVLSFQSNPHSFSWLLAFFSTTVLLIIAIRKNNKSALHRSYLIYLLNLNQYLLVVWVLHIIGLGSDEEQSKLYASWAQRLLGVGSIFMPVALLHFTIRFSGLNGVLLGHIENVGWIAATVFAIANVTGWLCPDYFWAGVTWVPALHGGYKWFFYFTTFYIAVGMTVPIITYYRSRSDSRRNELLFFILGATPLWIACWSNFLISLRVPLYPSGGLTFLLHAAIMSYAVLAHRLFDVHIVIRRTFAYAVCLAVLGGVYGLLLLLSIEALSAKLIFIILTALVYAPVAEWCRKKLDSIFARNVADRELILEEFARGANASLDLDALAKNISSILFRALKPHSLFLYLRAEDGSLRQFCSYDGEFKRAGWPESIEVPRDVTLALANSTRALRLQRSLSVRPEQVIQFGIGDEALAVPISHAEESLGFLVLEPKLTEEPYNESDIRFAEMVAAHSSLALLHAKAFEQLKMLQSLNMQTLSGLSAGVLVVDEKGVVIQINDAAKRIVGAPDPVVDLRSIWLAQPILGSVLKRSIDVGEVLVNEELRLEGPQPIFLLMSVRPLEKMGYKRLFLIILHDVTEYMAITLQAQQRESLAKVGEAIASINHEINNLLQPIRYQAHKLSEMELEDLETQRRTIRRALMVIPDQLEAIESLLRNLKDLSRPIELRIQSITIREIFETVWEDLKGSTMAAGVKYNIEIQSEAQNCNADGHWLRQVVFNLVRNAVEATAGRSNPIVQVKSAVRENFIEISVKDNGSGMDATSLNKLFEPFFSTKGQFGTGLGLSVSRKIIELHGGKICVTSEPEVGSEFTVLLPRNRKELRAKLSP